MRTRPHYGINLQEKLDVLLTAAAFDQKLTLLFLDDGVFQLKKTQHPEKQQLKDTSSVFNALEMYNVTELYIEAESMQERGLKQSNLTLPIEVIDRNNINTFIRQFEIIISG